MSTITLKPEAPPCATPTDMLTRVRDAAVAGLPLPPQMSGLWMPRSARPALSLTFGFGELPAVHAWTSHLRAVGCQVIAAGTGRGYMVADGMAHQLCVELVGWLGWRVVLRSSMHKPIAAPPCDCGSGQHEHAWHTEACAEVDAALAAIRAGAR